MNRRQEERIADLGRAFQEAITDIIHTGEEVSQPMEAYEDEIVDCEPEQERLSLPRPTATSAYPPLASHAISIQQVHNGFIVSMGCQTFVFEKFETASRYMTMYFQDPEGTEKKHRDGTLFSK